MAADDMRYYETFYGIHADNWAETFGSFINHHKLLVKDYLSLGANTTDASTASAVHKFLYPQHIKKTYFIEGVITGHITFESSTVTAYLCAYRVTVCKVHEDTSENELFTTGWTVVNHTLGWDSTYSVPDDTGSKVFPFFIDAWQKEKLTEHERIYLKIESTCSDTSSCVSCDMTECSNVSLWHSNDATWEDVKVILPLRM